MSGNEWWSEPSIFCLRIIPKILIRVRISFEVCFFGNWSKRKAAMRSGQTVKSRLRVGNLKQKDCIYRVTDRLAAYDAY